jgi:uncharacterized protein
MRWEKGHQSADVEDRRRGGVRGLPGSGKSQLGCGGILILLVLSVVFKQDFFSLLDQAGGIDSGTSASVSDVQAGGPDPDQELKEFVSFVLDDAQGIWQRTLPNIGAQYRNAKLVLFTDATRSGCGFAQSATGPFYCPADEKVYIDLGFYRELRSRFGAPGDFAQAYVLAHEIGHHVQNVLGISEQVTRMQQQNRRQANQLSVKLELQADCLAGIWAHSTKNRDLLEQGDVEEGMAAAAAVGDDRIQRMSGQYVNPDAFTHGSSQQRVQWFQKGLQTGDPDACDTFS